MSKIGNARTGPDAAAAKHNNRQQKATIGNIFGFFSSRNDLELACNLECLFLRPLRTEAEK